MKDYIKELVLSKGYSSLYDFCRKNGLDYHRVWETLKFMRVSRPLVLTIAEILDSPEIVYMYEKKLQQRKGRKQ
jgi:hypothetical protein